MVNTINTNGWSLETAHVELGKLIESDSHHTVITGPAFAQACLSHNDKNRAISQHHVRKLSIAMLNGEFFHTGQCVIFGSSGILIDGQHRLLAVAQSGVNITQDFRFGISPEAVKYIDTGKKRSNADLMSMQGIKNAQFKAPIVAALNAYDSGSVSGFRGVKIEPANIMNIYERYNDALLQKASSKSTRLKKVLGIQNSHIAAIYYKILESEPERGEVFFDLVSYGTTEKDNPVFWLRELVESPYGDIQKAMSVATIMAWNEFSQKRKRTKPFQMKDAYDTLPDIYGAELRLAMQ